MIKLLVFFIKRLIRLWKRLNCFHCSFSIDESDSLTVDLFQRSTRAIRSRSNFLNDWREWFDQGRSFSKIEKSERLNIERSKDWIPNPDFTSNTSTKSKSNSKIYFRLFIGDTEVFESWKNWRQKSLDTLPFRSSQCGWPPLQLPRDPGKCGTNRTEPIYIGRRDTLLGHVIRDTFYTLTCNRWVMWSGTPSTLSHVTGESCDQGHLLHSHM